MQDKTNIRQNQRQGVYVLCCLALSLFGCLAGPDGDLGQLEEEIVNPGSSGDVTAPTDAVIIREPVAGAPAGTLGSGTCTGTRIGDGRVLTAAHCLVPETERVGLQLGTSKTDRIHSFVRIGTDNYAMASSYGKRNFVNIGNLFGKESISKTLSKDFGKSKKITALVTNNGTLYGTGWTADAGVERAALFKFSQTSPSIVVSTIPLDGPGTSGSALTHYTASDGQPHFAVAIKSTVDGVEHSKVVAVDMTTLAVTGDIYTNIKPLRISELATSADGSIVIGATNIDPYFHTVQFIRCTYQIDWSCPRDEYNDGFLSNSLHDMKLLGDDIIALVSTGDSQSIIRRNPNMTFSLGEDFLEAHWIYSRTSKSTVFDASSIATDGVGRIYVGGFVRNDSLKHKSYSSGLILGLNSDLEPDSQFSAHGILPDKRGRILIQHDEEIMFPVDTTGPLLVEPGRVHLPMLFDPTKGKWSSEELTNNPIMSYNGPSIAKVNGKELSNYQYADGIDMAVATYTDVLPDPSEPTFPGYSEPPDSSTFQCIGIGGTVPDQLRQGTFRIYEGKETSPPNTVKISAAHGQGIAGGDSGGPCFDNTGSLVGVMINGRYLTGEMVSGSTAEEFVNSLSSQP